MKYKSKMKAVYAKAGIPTARYALVSTYENAQGFYCARWLSGCCQAR